MGNSTNTSKLLLLIIISISLTFISKKTSFYFLIIIISLFFFTGFGILMYWAKTAKSVNDFHLIFLLIVILPFVLALFLFRISLIPVSIKPPENIISLDPQRPDYNKSYIARVIILDNISPKKHLTRVQLLEKQIKTKNRYFIKSNKSFKKRIYHKNKFYKNKLFRKKIKKYYKYSYLKAKTTYKKYRLRNKAKYFRQKSKYKKFKKRYRMSKWKTTQKFSKTSNQSRKFQALITIYNSPVFHKGCRLKMRIYGRGVPGKTSKSFQKYLSSMAMSTAWRASGRYHIISHSCPPMGIRSQIRQKIHFMLENNIRNRQIRNLLTALVFGKSSFLDYDTRQIIARTGILHLFAASGLHLGIFYLCFYLPLGFLLGKRSWITLLLSLLPCLLFVYILKFPLSLVRAFIFICIHSIYTLSYKKTCKTTLVLNTLIIIAFIMPQKLLSIGNVLSFGAVTGILYFYKTLHIQLLIRSKLLQFAWAQFCLSVTASLFTTPIVIFIFGGYPALSLIYNIILVPITGFILPFLYLTMGVFIFIQESAIHSIPFSLIESAFYIILQTLPEKPIYIINTSTPGSPVYFCFLCIISLIILKFEQIQNQKKYLSRYNPGYISKGHRDKLDFIKIKRAGIVLFWISIVMLSPAGLLFYHFVLKIK